MNSEKTTNNVETNSVEEVEPPTPPSTPRYKNLVDMTYEQLEKELEKMCDLNIVVPDIIVKEPVKQITKPTENLKLKMIEGIISGFNNLETTINKFDSIKYHTEYKKRTFNTH